MTALTLREPPRGLSEGLQTDSVAPTTAADVIRLLWRARSFRHLSMASALYAFVGYSVVTWSPSFLARSHHMEQGDIGTALALIFGIGGGLGIYLGGVIADRLSVTNPLGRVRVPMWAQLLGFPFGFVVYTTDNTVLCLALFTIPAFLGLMFQGPAFAITQSLVTPSMRATAAAVLLFVINIVGLAIGPALTGAISDALEPSFGDDSLRYALLIVSMAVAWSGFHFYRAGKTLVADLDLARAASERESAGLSIWEPTV